MSRRKNMLNSSIKHDMDAFSFVFLVKRIFSVATKIHVKISSHELFYMGWLKAVNRRRIVAFFHDLNLKMVSWLRAKGFIEQCSLINYFKACSSLI